MANILPGAFHALDWILAAGLLFFALLKGSRGFYDSLAPLIVTLTAIVGASVLTLMLSGRVAEYLYPYVREELGSRMDLSAIRTPDLGVIASQLGRMLPELMSSLLRKLHLEPRLFVEEAAQSLSGSAGAAARRIAEDAVSAMLLSVTGAVVRVLLFFLAFVVIKLLLTPICKAAGVAFDLPVIRVVDRLGGFLLGLLECAIALYLLFWLLDLFSPGLFERLRDGSAILAYVFKQ